MPKVLVAQDPRLRSERSAVRPGFGRHPKRVLKHDLGKRSRRGLHPEQATGEGVLHRAAVEPRGTHHGPVVQAGEEAVRRPDRHVQRVDDPDAPARREIDAQAVRPDAILGVEREPAGERPAARPARRFVSVGEGARADRLAPRLARGDIPGEH
jgi:hypothetical protein